MGRRLNFEEPEIFKLRFGRYPKKRSIEDIHYIWMKLLEREIPRKKLHSDVWDEIGKNKIDTIYIENKGELYEYKFSYNLHYKSLSYTHGVLKFKNEKGVDERDKKLEFILANDYQFDLGKRFKETRKWVGKFQHRIKHIFIKKVEEFLRNRFKDKTPDIINIVSVGDKKYYFIVKDPFSYYLEFEFGGEVKENIINI